MEHFKISKEKEREQKKLKNDTLLCQAIVHSGTTVFRFVEDPYFRAFCHGISEGRYEPPSRRNISGRLLDKNTARALEQKKKNIGSEEGFTLTSDGWEDVNGNSIVNFVLTSASGLTISLKEFRAKKKEKNRKVHCSSCHSCCEGVLSWRAVKSAPCFCL
jgi:hypothetical protein